MRTCGHRFHFTPIWLAGLCLAACVAQPTASAPAEVTRLVEVTAPPRVIRIAYSSEADFGDLPSLMALDLLAAQGYAVLPINFAEVAIAVEALSQGDADIGMGNMNSYWTAMGQGAQVVTVMEQVANLWQIFASVDVQECANLDGSRFAVSSEATANARMADVYIAQNCPETERQIVLIQGSQNRAAALLAGEIDATTIELADAIELGLSAPGRFHTLSNFGQDLPGLKGSGVHVNRDFAAQHPEAVRDYLAAVLTIHRQVRQDHDLLIAEATRRLDIEADALPAITEAYFAINAWDVNGGLTEADVKFTLDFFTDIGDLDAGLTVSDVADLSYVTAALDESGRQE